MNALLNPVANHKSSRRVLVIGGGVAGSACGLRLRARGIDVTIAEQAVFPRDKVCGCCLGGAGLQALDDLGLAAAVCDAGVATRRWQASLGGRRIDIPLPTGVAISRRVLDCQLLDAAHQAGAEVLTACRATIESIGPGQVVASLEDVPQQRSAAFDVVVLASGLNASGGKIPGGLGRHLPWQVSPHGPYGIAFSAICDQVEPGIIYMACDEDGYVGLVRLEDGRVDIAAALNSGSKAAAAGTPKDRVEAILARSELPKFALDDVSTVMTTPPLRRRRSAGAGRLLAVGDAAGYIEPFTGEGMTWAMRSGIEAAETIASCGDDLSLVGQCWDRRQASLLRGKKLACRAVTTALRSPWLRRAAGGALSTWPKLASPLIRSLNRG